MQYFKTLGGMLSHTFEQLGEVDEKGELIVATEQPMVQSEFIEHKGQEIFGKIEKLNNRVDIAKIETPYNKIEEGMSQSELKFRHEKIRQDTAKRNCPNCKHKKHPGGRCFAALGEVGSRPGICSCYQPIETRQTF